MGCPLCFFVDNLFWRVAKKDVILQLKCNCTTMAKNADDESPLMKQHAELKKKFPDAMLLFRVGDFYETFGEDARKASQVLATGQSMQRGERGVHHVAPKSIIA